MGASCDTLYAGLCHDSGSDDKHEHRLNKEAIHRDQRKIQNNNVKIKEEVVSNKPENDQQTQQDINKSHKGSQKNGTVGIDNGYQNVNYNQPSESFNIPPTSMTVNELLQNRDTNEQKHDTNDLQQMRNIRLICRFRPTNRVEKADQKEKRYINKPPTISGNTLIKLESHSHNMVKKDIKKSAEEYQKEKNLVFGFIRNNENELDVGIIAPLIFHLCLKFYYIDRKIEWKYDEIRCRMCSRNQPPWSAECDYVFDSNANQNAVFKVVGVPLINEALQGFNATILAYGQTGAGKTYSMFGGNDLDSMGIMPRAFVYLFDKLETYQSNDELSDYKVSISMLQIYNRTLMDLLAIKTDFENDNVYVENLRKINIASAREALAVLIEGSKNRIIAGHKLNFYSSRSDLLVLLKMEQHKCDANVVTSHINFGDLAGSENIRKAHRKRRKQDMKARRREGISIGVSLAPLTATINALAKGQHPSYRSSPLTHILQDSLGGNSSTTLLLCASPHSYNRAETMRTLRFGQTAKNVRNNAKANIKQSK